MIRVLLIGREAPARVQALGVSLGAQIQLDAQTMPAAGLRRFEETSPDAVAIIEPENSARAAMLARALRERPLGQLIPIIALAPAPENDEGGAVEAWIAPAQGDSGLARALASALGVDLAADPGVSGSFFAPKPAQPSYFIEEIDEPEEQPPADIFPVEGSGFADLDGFSNQPRHLSHAAIFPSSGSRLYDLRAAQPGGLSASMIQEKLQAVRHRDYYDILELRRGAEGAQIREAFHRLYRQFDPEQLDFSTAHRFEAELAEICDALEDAWAVLGDPQLREAYLAQAPRR